MSQEIINVLNYIGEKLGIAIDWTAENVWPQVMEILTRYRLYEIASNSVLILLNIAMFIVCIIVAKEIVKARCKAKSEKENNFFWEYNKYVYHEDTINMSFASCFIITILIILTITSFIAIPNMANDLLKWIIIPEIQILELLQGYVN